MKNKSLDINQSNNKFKFSVLITVFSLICVIGISYAFFQYSRTANNTSQIIAGDVYL